MSIEEFGIPGDSSDSIAARHLHPLEECPHNVPLNARCEQCTADYFVFSERKLREAGLDNSQKLAREALADLETHKQTHKPHALGTIYGTPVKTSEDAAREIVGTLGQEFTIEDLRHALYIQARDVEKDCDCVPCKVKRLGFLL
ncbi:MAG TPA: hypothetical protein VIU40_13210 [Geobacteraceae bacterium]